MTNLIFKNEGKKIVVLFDEIEKQFPGVSENGNLGCKYFEREYLLTIDEAKEKQNQLLESIAIAETYEPTIFELFEELQKIIKEPFMQLQTEPKERPGSSNRIAMEQHICSHYKEFVSIMETTNAILNKIKPKAKERAVKILKDSKNKKNKTAILEFSRLFEEYLNNPESIKHIADNAGFNFDLLFYPEDDYEMMIANLEEYIEELIEFFGGPGLPKIAKENEPLYYAIVDIHRILFTEEYTNSVFKKR